MDVDVRKSYYFLTCCIAATFGSVLGDLLLRYPLGLHNLGIGLFIGVIAAAFALWILERRAADDPRYTDAPH